jgi:hypothetical protein
VKCLKIIEEVEETVEVEEKRRSSCLMFSIVSAGDCEVLYEAIASGDQDLDLKERERDTNQCCLMSARSSTADLQLWDLGMSTP